MPSITVFSMFKTIFRLVFSPFWLLRLDWTKTTTQTATEPLPRGTRWDKVRSRTAVSAGTMYGTVFVVRTGVFIQARGQQDTSDIYRFDDMSAEVVKFFLNTASFIFEHELKRKKKTGGEGLGPLGTSALMTDVL